MADKEILHGIRFETDKVSKEKPSPCYAQY